MKKLAVASAALLLAVVVTAVAVAAAKKTVWTAALSSGQEVPKQVVKDANAHGLFKGTVSDNKLTWKLTYAKLTGPATAAHIHMAARGKPGDVVIALCAVAPACKSGLTGTTPLTAAERIAFKKHLLYVNVHTAKNPAGEIRGQLSVG
jgi:Cu/Zn superoxide dismutase